MNDPVGASITVCPRGPLIVRGDFELISGMGLPIDPRRGTVALCRCGGSKIKPFCDGSHKMLGFDEIGSEQHPSPGAPEAPSPTTQENITMSENTENLSSNDEKTKEDAKRKDHVSDPSLNTDPGHDWTDEGGATPGGAATDVDPDKDPVDGK